jgi:hypothetical protein
MRRTVGVRRPANICDTISAVDIATGCGRRGDHRAPQKATEEGLDRYRQRRRFPIRDSPYNDTGLINLLWRYCRKAKITTAAVAAVQKNDNACGTAQLDPRAKMVGYRRMDNRRLLVCAICMSLTCTRTLSATMKLQEKVRVKA